MQLRTSDVRLYMLLHSGCMSDRWQSMHSAWLRARRDRRRPRDAPMTPIVVCDSAVRARYRQTQMPWALAIGAQQSGWRHRWLACGKLKPT